MAGGRVAAAALLLSAAALASAARLRLQDAPDDAFWQQHHPANNPASSANHDDLACKPGSVFDGTQCKPCPANTFRALGMHECKACPSGTSAAGGAASCASPPQGGSGSGSGAGSSSSAASAPAVAAAAPKVVAPAADPNHEDLACSPGNVFDGSKCKPCPANTYRSQGMHDCLPCAQGKVSGTGSVECTDPQEMPADMPNEEFWKQMHPSSNPSSPANHDDLACKPGAIFDGAQCKPCPANTYRAIGMHDCVACPPGQVSLPGAVNCFTPVDAGSGSGSGPAAAAAAATTPPVPSLPPQDAAAQSPPPLPAAVAAAAPQQPAVTCSPGSVPSPKGDECYACPSGQFSDDPATPCTPCPQGFTSSAGASTCEPCPQGTYAGAQGQAECTPCGQGFYNAYFGATNTSACLPCPSGFHCPAKTTHTPIKCGRHERAGSPGSAQCEECPSMFHSNPARTACKPVAAFYALVSSAIAVIVAIGVFVYNRTVSAPVRRSWADTFSPDDLNDGEYGQGYQHMRPGPDQDRAAGSYGTL